MSKSCPLSFLLPEKEAAWVSRCPNSLDYLRKNVENSPVMMIHTSPGMYLMDAGCLPQCQLQAIGGGSLKGCREMISEDLPGKRPVVDL